MVLFGKIKYRDLRPIFPNKAKQLACRARVSKREILSNHKDTKKTPWCLGSFVEKTWLVAGHPPPTVTARNEAVSSLLPGACIGKDRLPGHSYPFPERSEPEQSVPAEMRFFASLAGAARHTPDCCRPPSPLSPFLYRRSPTSNANDANGQIARIIPQIATASKAGLLECLQLRAYSL